MSTRPPRPATTSRAESKKDRALREVRGLILSGALRGGQPISESILMAMTGLSQAPIRQAIARLQAEGLVDIDARQASHVRPVSSFEIQSIVGLRFAVEGLVASTLAERAATTDLGELDEIARAMRAIARGRSAAPALEDKRAFVELDISFHVKLAELAGFVDAMQLLGSLNTKMQLYATLALQTRADMKAVVGEHDLILKEVKAGRAVRAREAASRHLVRASDRWFPSCKEFLRVDVPRRMGLATARRKGSGQARAKSVATSVTTPPRT